MRLLQLGTILIVIAFIFLFSKNKAETSNNESISKAIVQEDSLSRSTTVKDGESPKAIITHKFLPFELGPSDNVVPPLVLAKNALFQPQISNKAASLLKDGPIKGFTLGLQSKAFDYDYTLLLKEIKATGAPWVCLSFTVSQDSNSSSSINIPPVGSPYWKQIETTATQAKALGFKVVIFPIVLINKPKFREWRGTLRPLSYDGWYASYEALMTIVAQIATRTNVDMLSVGSEFSSLDRAEERWYHVIKVIKKVYKGALMYSANWDTLFNIQFQDQLDFLGLTGYFSLTKKKDPSVQELIAAWKPLKALFKKWQKEKNIPLLFSELGYTSQDGINMHPWNYTTSNMLDLKEQKDCYTAFTKVWKDEKALYGVFFYEWFGKGGKNDHGYTPRGKPALDVAMEWF